MTCVQKHCSGVGNAVALFVHSAVLLVYVILRVKYDNHSLAFNHSIELQCGLRLLSFVDDYCTTQGA